MKRIFALCLVLALLAGCAPAPNAPSSGAPASPLELCGLLPSPEAAGGTLEHAGSTKSAAARKKATIFFIVVLP